MLLDVRIVHYVDQVVTKNVHLFLYYSFIINKHESRQKLRGEEGFGKNLRKNGNLSCFCMSLGESLLFSAILEKYIIKSNQE